MKYEPPLFEVLVDWRPWFAWFPVYSTGRQCWLWFEVIETRCVAIRGVPFFDCR